uniref:Uncharacterized protein n=1 Tax=Oryza punctata TaxID=4537 RepID=A0A0E0L2D1_ORYPU
MEPRWSTPPAGAPSSQPAAPVLKRIYFFTAQLPQQSHKDIQLVVSKRQGCCLANVSATGTADLPCPDHCKELLHVVITSFLEASDPTPTQVFLCVSLVVVQSLHICC